MKSKSFEIKQSPAEKSKLNKTYDFVGLYKTAAETNAKLSEKRKSGENVNTENSFNSKAIGDTPKVERSPYKKSKKGKYEPVEVSSIHIDGGSLGPKYNSAADRSSPVNVVGATSTPLSKGKIANTKVKSIMKNSSSNDDAMDGSGIDVYTHKPKKRNKSVSFMLEDHEEVAIKKTKSEDSIKIETNLEKKTKKRDKIEMKKNLKKIKKHLKEAEKENKRSNMETDQTVNTQSQGIIKDKKSKVKPGKEKSEPQGEVFGNAESPVTDNTVTEQVEKKKKLKKIKKQQKMDDSSEPTENESNNNDQKVEQKYKKFKKKKRHVKSVQVTDTTETEGEPAVKSRKKEAKPDVIAEDLENLTIGDNAHTLTNLLDEMAVVDKDKKKKNKVKRKGKDKTASVSSSETADLEKIEEGKEKVKWRKRKWNKDRKGDGDDNNLANMVIVDNLPLSLMFTYKKMLADHFGKFGQIKKIGIAEVYPTEEPKPVFTTSIVFTSNEAAVKALEEDNTELSGGRIRVKAPLPPTLTTLVVRSYGEMTEQALSSVFTGAGRIRNIKHLVKGRKAMATAFVEFDGPEAVGKAIKMAEDAKIGGKKIHVSKYDQRRPKRSEKKGKNNTESENEGDSEDSND